MERYPVPPALGLSVHRRGSNPSLVQYAVINAKIKKERTSPSLEIINNADTDEDTDDPADSSDRLKSMGGVKSQSQPALNILHITSIRGKDNLSEVCAQESSCAMKRTVRTASPLGDENNISNSPREAIKKDMLERAVSPESPSQMLKRSSSHGCVVAQPLRVAIGTSVEPHPTVPSPDRIANRRNTWCHASGTSAVAIDNKIEQAMDLVKSHLMFAVREEVEVLKEKIAELMERISQLELENSILRAHATQETLAQLSAPAQGAVGSTGAAAPAQPSPPSGPVS